MIWVRITQAFAVAALHFAFGWSHRTRRKAKHVERPGARVNDSGHRRAGRTYKIREKRAVDWSAPTHRLSHGRRNSITGQHIESFKTVDGTERVLHGVATTVDFVTKLAGVADKPMRGARQPVTINLISMSQARLHDTIGALDLLQQTMHVWGEIFINLGDVRSNHRSEQNPADSGCGLDGQDEVAESQPTCR